MAGEDNLAWLRGPASVPTKRQQPSDHVDPPSSRGRPSRCGSGAPVSEMRRPGTHPVPRCRSARLHDGRHGIALHRAARSRSAGTPRSPRRRHPKRPRADDNPYARGPLPPC
jgi:hypothetical protein